jgi:hypothetical protein
MKTTIDSQIIGAVVSTLEHAVTPRVTDPSAAAALDMSLQLLNFVALGDSPNRADQFGGAADERGGEADWAAMMSSAADEAKSLEQLLALKAPVSAAPQGIPLDILQSYIRERLSGGGSARVVALIPSLGGFSKETYIVTLENAAVERLVIRRDPVAGPVERTAAEEFSILQSAFEQGVPVPEPLWADAQPPFGRSVVVTRFAGGHSAFDLTGSAIGVGQSPAAVGLAAALAKVHAMRFGPATHSVGLSTHVRASLDLLEAQWRRRRIWGSEILECACSCQFLGTHGGARRCIAAQFSHRRGWIGRTSRLGAMACRRSHRRPGLLPPGCRTSTALAGFSGGLSRERWKGAVAGGCG